MEVIGHTPRSKEKRTTDYLIVERRRQERIRSDNEVQKAYFETTLYKSNFLHDTDRKIERKKQDEYVAKRLKENEEQLNKRRQRLQSLLAKEKAQFTSELMAQEETMEQREEKMRQTVNHMKAMREAEQKAIVKRKLEQRWHNNCDDLRGAHSHVAQQKALKVRNQQMIELQEKARQLKLEKLRDAQQWEEDRQRKIAREEADTQKRLEKSRETMQVLAIQLQRSKKNKEDAMRLRSEQAELLKEQLENQKRESQVQMTAKRDKQILRAQELDHHKRLKDIQIAKEKEEELSIDLDLLNRAMEGMEKAGKREDEKRERLKRETKMYQQYIQEMKQYRAEREAEFDEIQNKEKEMVWQAKLAGMEKQTAARQAMMKEVLMIRQEQIQAKLKENQKEIEINNREAEQLRADVEAARKTEETREKKIEETRLKYKAQLDQQIEFNQHNVALENKMIEYEYEQEKINEAEYQQRLKMEIDRMMRDL